MNSEKLRELEELKTKAEFFYSQMYVCKSYELKDFKDDASSCLSQALVIAEELELSHEVKLLQERSEHVRNIYNQLNLPSRR